MARDLFISYAHQDRSLADALCAAFERAGISCWIAPRDVPAGASYAAEIAKAIPAARGLVVLLTTDANSSRSVLNEVELATSRERLIAPVRIADAKPVGALEYYLNAVQWFDASEPLEASFEQAARFVAGLLHGGARSAPVGTTAGLLLPTGPLRARYNNLPQRLTPLVGRDRELDAVAALLDEHRLITITGTGGTGKTRVALHVGTQQLARHADGVWFVDLAPLQSPEFVLEEVASVLSVSQSLQRPLLDDVLEFLRPRALLLVMDNCEHVIGAAAELCETIVQRCGSVRILTTSREPLEIEGERIFRLPSLEESAAVELFYARAGDRNVALSTKGDDARLVATICRRLDGIPLAIELAAACVGLLSLSEIDRGLDSRFSILTRGRRTALPRHQTMRAAFDWSYQVLDPEEQRCFRELAVFAGGFRADAARAVCTIDGALERLGSLARKSLIAVRPGTESRYEILESAREYGRDHLGADLPTLSTRHLTWLHGFVGQMIESEPTARQQSLLEQLDPELANIRAALDWGLAHDELRELACGVVSGLSSFWYDAGLVQEGVRWIERALEALDADRQPLLVGRLWRALAFITKARRSAEAAQKAVDLVRRSGGDYELAVSLTTLSVALRQVGELERAAAAGQNALDILQPLNLHRSRLACDVLQALGSVQRIRGLTDEARAALDKALSLAEELAEERVAASIAGDLAELEFACGNTERAIELVTESAEIFRRLKAVTREATALVNASTYLLESGRIDEARRAAGDALQRSLWVGDSLIASVALQNLSAVHALRGDAHVAARLIGYVDRWYADEGFERDVSEQKIFGLVMTTLNGRLEVATLETLRSEGATWSEERAAAEANSVRYG